jgi:hypothetical protein
VLLSFGEGDCSHILAIIFIAIAKVAFSVEQHVVVRFPSIIACGERLELHAKEMFEGRFWSDDSSCRNKLAKFKFGNDRNGQKINKKVVMCGAFCSCFAHLQAPQGLISSLQSTLFPCPLFAPGVSSAKAANSAKNNFAYY